MCSSHAEPGTSRVALQKDRRTTRKMPGSVAVGQWGAAVGVGQGLVGALGDVVGGEAVLLE